MTVQLDSFYGMAASRIPLEILHEIEVSLPCPESADGEHRWEQDQVEIEQFGRVEPARIEEFWWCAHCSAGTRTRP